MKKTLIILLALCFATVGIAQDEKGKVNKKHEIVVEKVELFGQYPIKNPILNDTTDNNGNAFHQKRLLKSQISIENKLEKTVNANEDGTFIIDKSAEELQFYVVNFNMIAHKFIETSLQIETPDMVQIFINGEMKKEKTTVEDSLCNAAKTKVALTLDPNMYHVTLKFLAKKEEKKESAIFTAKILTDSTNYQNITLTESATKPINFAENLEGTYLSQMTISPSGKYILNKYYTTHKGGEKTTYFAELLERASQKVLLRFPKTSYTWMPKSDLLYFTETISEERVLKTFNPVTFEETVVCNKIPKDGSFQWAPTEEFLIFTIFTAILNHTTE